MARRKARRTSSMTPTPNDQPIETSVPTEAPESESPVVSDDDGIDFNYNDKTTASTAENDDTIFNPPIEQLHDSDSDVSLEDDDENVLGEGNNGEESDSSSDGDINPVGDIPMHWYDGYDHIGYDRSGKKIIASNKPTALDLASDPHAWRKLYDEKNDRMIELSHVELKAIARLRSCKHPYGSNIEDVNDEIIPWSGPVEQTPMPTGTEPKRRYLPSRHEARIVIKLVRAIREGKLKSDDNEHDDDEIENYMYDIWKEFEPKTREEMTKSERARDIMRILAPKPELPTHAESYNPPSEYLPSKRDARKWKYLKPEQRGSKYLPCKYDNLRHVPRYDDFVRERFERCLDLYLGVRMRIDQDKMKDDQTSDDLIPKLPKPSDLRPFPTDRVALLQKLDTKARAKTIDVHPAGGFLVVGCEDGRVRVLESASGYVRFCWDVCEILGLADGCDEKFPVNGVEWCPREDAFVFAAVVGKYLVVINASAALGMNGEESDMIIRKASKDEANVNEERERKMKEQMSDAGIEWKEHNFVENNENNSDNSKQGNMIIVKHKRLLRTLCWHRKGDYIACVGREGNTGTISVHRLSKKATQIPFKKCALVQDAKFHPTRPFFIVATMHHVRLYNLGAQQLVKTLRMSGSAWISSVDIHPSSGDHVIVTSFDRRVCWFDLDLSTRPYKTIRGHSKAVRIGKFHKRLPLFADGGDDGQCHVFHAMAYDNLNENALVVPVRKLQKCSKIVDALGVLDIVWHPRLALLYTCGADGSIGMYADCSQG